MKIVHVSPYPMARPGGVQSNVRDLCAWLDRSGHETRIVSPVSPGADLAPGEMALGRAREGIPDAIGQAAEKRHLDARIAAHSRQPRRQHAGVVQHQHVAGQEQRRQVAHDMVAEPALADVEEAG